MCIRAAPSASIESAVTTVHRDPTWAIGAAGSALPSHGRGRRFEPGIAHERPHSTGGVLRFRNPLQHPLPASTVTHIRIDARGRT